MGLVSLVNPPQLELREPYAYPPLGLCYLASTLEGFDVRIDNLAGEREIHLEHADIFGVTFPSACKTSVKRVLHYIRERYPHSTIILGGPHPTARPEETLKKFRPDYVVTGEAEFLFPFLIHHSVPKGIYDGGIIMNLDVLPLPRRDLLSRDVVVNLTGIHGLDKPSTTILSSRGCPYSCKFCCKCHAMYRVVRDRAPVKVIKEIHLLKDEYGIEHLRFIDDCFTVKRSLLKLCELLRNEEVTFICITRANHLNREMAKALKRAGCIQVDIGAEYLSNRMLKLMNKQLTVKRIVKAIEMLHEEGIAVKIFLMMRYPGETPEDRERTLQVLSETKPEHFTVSVFQPIEGSSLEGDSGYFYPDKDPNRQEYQKRILEALG